MDTTQIEEIKKLFPENVDPTDLSSIAMEALLCKIWLVLYEERCKYCNGEGVITLDTASPEFGHGSIQYPCHKCKSNNQMYTTGKTIDD